MRFTPRHAERIAWTHVATPGLSIGFLATVAVLVATLVVGLANLREVHARSDAVVQTYSVKIALQQLLTAMVDAETSERGFILTGDPGRLEPYNRTRDTIAAQVARVRGLIADNPEQRADLDRLSDTVNLKLLELSEAIQLRRQAGFAAAQARVANNVSKRTMDEIRSISSRMEAREDTLHAIRSAEADRSYRIARLTEIGATGLALVAVLALFVSMMRYGAMRLQAARAAEEQQTELREALHQKDDFVALVSHELRTPTNTIVGWARMLDEGTMRPESVKRAVAAIGRSAESLRQLIEDLMDTSQLVSGRMRLAIGDVDFGEVVRDAIDVVRLSAENRGVALTDAIQPDLPLIRGDAGRLKQIVWNLLANAIKFTPAGGHVTVVLVSTDAGLRLEVHDTGEGIDPAFLPHVFERYRQAAAATTSPRSLGLGLAIVRHLVELHGGTVTAHSPGRGRGSTFVIELPHAVSPVSPEPVSTSSAGRARPTSATGLSPADGRPDAGATGEIEERRGPTEG